MRATTLLNSILAMRGIYVRDVDPKALAGTGPIGCQVALSRRLLRCPHCEYTTARRYDRRQVDSSWRHLDLSGRRFELRMRRRRLRCPEHGVCTEGVPFARPGARFTRDFEDLVVWLVTRSDRSTVARFARVAWRTVGKMCERVSDEIVDADHLAGLVDIGVDEISWRKHHKYLTLVTDHDTSTVIWGAAGKNVATLDKFFEDLPEGGVDSIEAVSMDLGPAFAKSVRKNAPNAVLCFDAFHVVKLGGDALDAVRRQTWQQARQSPDKAIAKKYKGARWPLLKNPEDLTEKQAETLQVMRAENGKLWRAYRLKEALRAVFADDLDPDDALELLERWCSWAQRSRIPEFVTVAKTIRKNIDGIDAAVSRGLSNGRHEGLNNKIRTMLRRAYGFHSPEAALGLIKLACGPVELTLPYHT